MVVFREVLLWSVTLGVELLPLYSFTFSPLCNDSAVAFCSKETWCQGYWGTLDMSMELEAA